MKKEIIHCAIGLLSRREHSTKELIQKLSKREFTIEDIEPVVEFLLEEDYLSNERFADAIFRYRVGRGYGWRYIKHQLQQKGVGSEIFNSLNKNQEIDWYLQAELAYNKRFGGKAIKDQQDKAKRMRFLQYRGFSTDEIITVLNAS